MAEPIRKKIKWPTKKRNGSSRKWKTKWITVTGRAVTKSKGEPGAKGEAKA